MQLAAKVSASASLDLATVTVMLPTAVRPPEAVFVILVQLESAMMDPRRRLMLDVAAVVPNLPWNPWSLRRSGVARA